MSLMSDFQEVARFFSYMLRKTRLGLLITQHAYSFIKDSSSGMSNMEQRPSEPNTLLSEISCDVGEVSQGIKVSHSGASIPQQSQLPDGIYEQNGASFIAEPSTQIHSITDSYKGRAVEESVGNQVLTHPYKYVYRDDGKLCKIAQGNHADVVLITDEHCIYALKRMFNPGYKCDKLCEEILTEFNIQAKVYKETGHCPEPIKLLEQDFGTKYLKKGIVMEYVEPPEENHATLDDILNSKDTFIFKVPWRELIVNTITKLQDIHKTGIAHGDIHARNIILDKWFEPYFIDFGHSKPLSLTNIEHAVMEDWEELAERLGRVHRILSKLNYTDLNLQKLKDIIIYCLNRNQIGASYMLVAAL